MTYRCWRMRGISCFSGWFAGFVPLLSLEDASPDRAGALRATGAQRPFISPFPGSANTSCARIVNSSGDPPALGCASRGWDAMIRSVAPPTAGRAFFCGPEMADASSPAFLQRGAAAPLPLWPCGPFLGLAVIIAYFSLIAYFLMIACGEEMRMKFL